MQGMSTEPSTGMAWYLAAEAFPSTLQVCHTALLLVPWLALLPLAVCLHQEPLLLWALAALGGCIFAPSPTLTDLLRCLVRPASRAVSAAAVGLARWPSIDTKHGGWIRLELQLHAWAALGLRTVGEQQADLPARCRPTRHAVLAGGL